MQNATTSLSPRPAPPSPREGIPFTQSRAPQNPPRPCRKPGCGKLTTDRSGYCDEHKEYGEQKKIAWFKIADKRKESSAKRGYGSAWRKLRAAKLRQNPLCERCGEPATVVHHKDHNSWNDFWDNLESVCRNCHEEHHKRKRKDNGKRIEALSILRG